ncbi:MAG: ATP synthase F0 subunit B [Candidatus Fluviicola riflensis]|nr:MAG: ATP synthase F0 subunit B [Candidatus Fluviicola riflensis]OGS77909.1 MAG: ATP synthase F0 subunit B [Candidatus Fluviicola riflensis]OGS84974.1 MAG: ATP synthase F0 subunit B [Fluviicola sp. RIFCSPHIGHO2_01_FULL_43_53]OGS89246.1 MAG: ATP synthase F0 subunit B [Fluviicola sp. RIFCSPHIGHO2_12_FULL_43_24]
MELITPHIGLIFWTGLVFLLLMFILTKFVWKPVLKAVNEREQKISDALELAEKTKIEMKALQAQNENLLKEARAERDAIVKDAKETATKMVEDAKNAAKTESNKIVAAAREAINADKAAAISELKTQVAAFSIEIAEKIVRGELSTDGKQKALADKLAGDINLN